MLMMTYIPVFILERLDQLVRLVYLEVKSMVFLKHRTCSIFGDRRRSSRYLGNLQINIKSSRRVGQTGGVRWLLTACLDVCCAGELNGR